MIQKHNHFRSRKLLDYAKGQSCKNCGKEDGTVVAAHANWAEYGKGAMIKADDWAIAWLCSGCHSWLDQGIGPDPSGMWDEEEKRHMWVRAHARTLSALFSQGILVVK